MRDPARIVAATEIAAQVRAALEDGGARHESSGWDDEVLLLELGRLVGGALRWRDASPSGMEQVVDTLRRVYAGLMSHRIPEAEEVVAALCPERSGDAHAAGGDRTVQ